MFVIIIVNTITFTDTKDISWLHGTITRALYKETVSLNYAFTYVLKLFKIYSTVCFKFSLKYAYSRLTREKKVVRWISKNNINELLKLKLQELMKLVKHKNH